MNLSTRSAVLLSLAIFLGIPAAGVQAKDVEQRDYAVFVDGKEAGQSKLHIVVQDDGSIDIRGTVNVTVAKLIGQYQFSAESTERWQNGRLVSLRTMTTENGKKTEVQASAQKDQLRLRVNGQERNARPDAWTSSYWKLADARFHNKQVPVLESDTGKEHMGELKYVGAEKLAINGQQVECYRFRVTGLPAPIDLWFDRFHRLVRQEFMESGHRTIVQLTAVRR